MRSRSTIITSYRDGDIMEFDLGEPKYRGMCKYPDCDRTFGPYYSEHMMRDAQRDHIRAQHAGELPIMRQRQPGDNKMASATAEHPRYNPPSLTARHGHK